MPAETDHGCGLQMQAFYGKSPLHADAPDPGTRQGLPYCRVVFPEALRHRGPQKKDAYKRVFPVEDDPLLFTPPAEPLTQFRNTGRRFQGVRPLREVRAGQPECRREWKPLSERIADNHLGETMPAAAGNTPHQGSGEVAPSCLPSGRKNVLRAGPLKKNRGQQAPCFRYFG